MEAEDWIDDAQVAGAEVDEMAGARMIAVQSAVYVRDSGNFGATIKMRGQRFADKNEFATPRHATLICFAPPSCKQSAAGKPPLAAPPLPLAFSPGSGPVWRQGRPPASFPTEVPDLAHRAVDELRGHLTNVPVKATDVPKRREPLAPMRRALQLQLLEFNEPAFNTLIGDI